MSPEEHTAAEVPEDAVEVIIRAEEDGERADKAVARLFPDISRQRLKATFEAGQVWRAGQTLGRRQRVAAGETIALVPPKEKCVRITPQAMPLDVLYEDAALIAVNKATGLVVHPGNGVAGVTLVEGILHHTGGKLASAGGEERPGVVHRLDRDTSGVILFAKTDMAYYALVRAFAERNLVKEYRALVVGSPPRRAGSIEKPIGRHPVNRVKMAVRPEGRPAHTDWEVLECFGTRYALLRCRIHTGRTHQIRVHLSDMGTPIWGDTTYGYRRLRLERGVPPHFLLHAERLVFPHPDDGRKVELKAPLGPAFEASLGFLREEFGGQAVT